MKSTTKRWLRWAAPLAASALTCLILVVPIEAQLPSPGNNAVYNPSGHVVLSPAFIDASAFFPPNPGNHAADVCDAIFQILSGNLNFLQHGYPSTGAVIDLRGVSGANLTCHGSPWTEGTTTVTAPSTILLPAGTIVIPGTWVLPNNTHLIGEGDALNPPPATPVASGTILQANFSSGDMIDLCSSTCNSVSVEHLILDGQGQAINGIVNSNAQDGTYVDHVSLYQIRGTGLLVQTNATNSGPYSNITFDTGGYSGVGSTVCAQILNVSGGTHGLRQLSCTSESNDALAAILLDSSNNSIEDVTIVGFYDGILVGANGDAKSNVLVNIIGDTTPSNLTPINTVHIAPSPTPHTVADLSVIGLSNSGLSGTYTLQDDVTGTHLSDPTVGLYALGESANGGNARFTTSPNAATWAVGAISPTTGCNAANRGSLYSCTGSQCANAALWACALNSQGNPQWFTVP